MRDKPQAVVIGAGFTGCAIAHDLTLRGFKVSVYERGEIASGTSGRTHGLLHSGGRYCVNDREAGIECIDENITLRKIARQVIEYNGGLFMAINEDDLAFAPRFVAGAEACHIPIDEIKPKELFSLEPNLNPRTLLAYRVPDGAFDPLRLALAFAATAKSHGAQFFTYHNVEDMLFDGKGNVCGIKVLDRAIDKSSEVAADIVINATGAWAGHVAKMAKVEVPVIPTPGIMVAFDQRLAQMVVNRLNMPGDGDIIIPQRRMGVIGTTSFEVEDPDYIPVEQAQIEMMKSAAIEMIPGLKNTRIRGIYMSARPLIAASVQGRSLSRTFKCYDHAASHGVEGIITITGGKATTCRAMAEKTVDLACQKLGINAPCQTRDYPLISYREYYRM